jgi:hypothetical protein
MRPAVKDSSKNPYFPCIARNWSRTVNDFTRQARARLDAQKAADLAREQGNALRELTIGDALEARRVAVTLRRGLEFSAGIIGKLTELHAGTESAGWGYSICESCCRERGERTLACALRHAHDAYTPICATRAIIDGA